MSVEILTVKDNVLIPTVSCYGIPELKAIIDSYEDYLQVLKYLYFLHHPKSAYRNVPEEEKETIIFNDCPGNYSPEDSLIIDANEKLHFLYTTPTKRFFINAKRGLETLGDYLGTTSITDGKDGNFASLSMMYTRVGKMIDEFKKLEKSYDEETGSNIRGGAEEAYDEK